MSERIYKLWVIEEQQVGDEIAHRQTIMHWAEREDDDSWHWIMPEERLDSTAQQEWDRVMGLLSDVNGEDLRHVVCGVGLMDHCLNNPDVTKYL